MKRDGEYHTVHYKRGEMLEKEGMACYWKVKEVDTNKLWTCKIMPSLQKMTKEEHRVFHNHLNIVQQLEHLNIMKLSHWFEANDQVLMFFEHCFYGSLAKVQKQRFKLNELEIQCIAKQVLSVLSYLRSKQIVHGNVTLDNMHLNLDMAIKLRNFDHA